MTGLSPIYLDNQATTPCDPRVVQAMLPYFTTDFANAHSVEHSLGRRAEAAVDQAREQIAALIGAQAQEIVLTSGATEANNLAIKGLARHQARQGDERRRIITVATEHKCVLESVKDLAAEGFDPVILPVGRDGLVDLAVLDDALKVPTLLVSVMAVNNETGVIQDIPAIAAQVHTAGARLHCDAAQAAGKIPVDVRGWDVDLLSLSAHKMYGPKGVGALFVRRRPRVRLMPLFSGGGQERGLRSGTLPTPLVVGFGQACQIALHEGAQEVTRVAHLRDRLLHGVREHIPDLVVNGSWSRRIAGNLNITFPQGTALAWMAACPDLCVSTGSACGSAEIVPSYVLKAMGLSDAQAHRSLRLGLGRFTSAADVERAIVLVAAASGTVIAAQADRPVEV